MNLQYITDSEGHTTGVFIPIKEWNDLKSKFIGLDKEIDEIPEWHKEIVRERLENYKKNPQQLNDFDSAMDDLEKGL